MRLCAELKYILSWDFHNTCEKNETYFMTIAERFDLDIDGIADECDRLRESGLDIDFTKTIHDKIDSLYDGASLYDKSYIFYKFIHDSKVSIDHLNSTIYDDLQEVEISAERVNSFLNNINESYEYILNFFKTFKTIYLKLAENVYFTFNDIMYSEYKKNTLKQSPNISYFIDSLNTTTNISYFNDSLNTSTNISYFNDRLNTSTNISYFNDSLYSSYFINTPPKINPPIIKKTRTPEYKILKKSLKGLMRFINGDDFKNLMDQNKGLHLVGTKFNWLIKLRSRKDLISGSKYMNNQSIDYDLILLNKDDETICKICIVYKDCPILDEILTNYLLIKTGKEDTILEIGNVFSKSNLYKNYFPNGKVMSNVLDSLFINNVINEEIKSEVRFWTKNVLNNLISRDYIEYAFNLDVSFGEAIDYVASNMFDIKVFDYLVKKIKWTNINIRRNNAGNNILKLLR